MFTARLLLVGLPLTIAAGYLLARGPPPRGRGLARAAAGRRTRTHRRRTGRRHRAQPPWSPVRVRRILNVESGPERRTGDPPSCCSPSRRPPAPPPPPPPPEHGRALAEALREIAVGALVGLLAGYLAGRLLERAPSLGGGRRSRWCPSRRWPSPCSAYYGAVELHGNGYIAAFVAGAAFASAQADVARTQATLELTDQVSAFLGYAVWMLFGIVVSANLDLLVRASCSDSAATASMWRRLSGASSIAAIRPRGLRRRPPRCGRTR